MLTIRWRWKGKCPQHPRYDPSKHGKSAIKGNCPTCFLLFRVHELHHMTAEHAQNYDELQRAGETIAVVRCAADRVFGNQRRTT